MPELDVLFIHWLHYESCLPTPTRPLPELQLHQPYPHIILNTIKRLGCSAAASLPSLFDASALRSLVLADTSASCKIKQRQ